MNVSGAVNVPEDWNIHSTAQLSTAQHSTAQHSTAPDTSLSEI